ncbi:ATP-dependent DNA helicase RecG [Campylobacter ureolyticus]|uniref:ATP-dependent DNA helicase RecG n=1 Tax=Campylobacter ureolyticus TaxID=827 RepID=A0A9Q4KJZ8_9BACT|nr:ATP-dependent DNA helicase RecG [Campylobacter ureolyticus]MCZ6159036.1 ATP-dependent DNA helicase RecG [Campylobacter ureolyticus]MCZ6162881.1 ATP-dependent DNA helicase RecG [Campylobacter ureolyticus]MCZ6164626.1 ATP-dependent DNA helicase RecG [Campylobacter ureolyticus]MCZ6166425.1 ATP-dependent DNA helicase RecG [Campylobacter ureolyticus]
MEILDKKELDKLGVKTLIDLALILPKNFEDLTLSHFPNEGDNTVLIECKFMLNKGSFLSITAFCVTWNLDIRVIIFNARPWHYGAFKNGKKIYITGKSSFYNSTWQFTNPKIITKIGEILPKYKLSLKDDKITSLIEKYLNKDGLLSEGLNEFEAEFLLKLHQKSKESIKLVKNLELDNNSLKMVKFIEIFNYMKKLSKKKFNFPAKKIEIYDISSWIKTLPFTPTNDQINALNDVKNDLLSCVAKRRVVMGDVGSGKTLIMLGASLMVYPQTAILMAPTSILAEQIYNEALKLLPKFMKIMLVKSGDKELDFKDINLIVGTHALLFQPLPKANLIMVDEQHRFGSNQRQKINNLTKDGKFKAHFLQFSATPIPRTLSLIQSNIVEQSFLKQMPFKKDIKTIIINKDGFFDMIKHIKDEISKGKQAIIVYPLVEESQSSNYQSLNEGSTYWYKNFKNVYLTHGGDKVKEEILKEFRDKGDLLLTTTVVEVGISLPRLSIIVVVAPERMGLATLHQLRGRVGRNGGSGWCYLFTKLKESPSRLLEFAKTLDGFKVAGIDLKNRQSGDLLDGSIQHGATFKFYDYEEDIADAAKKRLEILR